MYPSTIFKGSILLIFLCCLPHISNAKTNPVKDTIVGTSILGGIAKAAQRAVTPLVKLFLEGPAGFVIRYYTLNDHFGIGQSIKKAIKHHAIKAGTATVAVKKTIKKWAQKRLEENMEEVNRWYIRQKLSAINGLAAGIGAGVGAVITDEIYNKFGDTEEDHHHSSSEPETTTKKPKTTTKKTKTPTKKPSKPDDDHIAVSISKPFYAKPWSIGDLWGPWSDPHLVVMKPSEGDSSASQVIIGKPVGDHGHGHDEKGEHEHAETSSTVAVWGKDPISFWFKYLFGGSGKKEEKSSEASGNELSKLREEEVNVLQGQQRSVRSVDETGVDPLVSVFERVAQNDPQQCLPMVLCAIHADPERLLTPQETNLITVFRPLVIQRHVPAWAEPWVRGARQGAAAPRGNAEEANITCRKTFPNCPFSAHHLRTLMASTFGVNPQSTETRKDDHLELNVV